MKTKTQIKIDDDVWFMVNNKPSRSRVYSITHTRKSGIQPMFGMYHTTITVGLDKNNLQTFNGDDIFTSKSELALSVFGGGVTNQPEGK